MRKIGCVHLTKNRVRPPDKTVPSLHKWKELLQVRSREGERTEGGHYKV